MNDQPSLREILPRDLDLDQEIERLAAPQPQSRRPIPYSPPSHDPVQLAGQTVKSVARVGADSAKEIEEVADAVMQGAAKVAEHLRALAKAIQDHSDNASSIVEDFCKKASTGVETVRSVHDRMFGDAKTPSTVIEPPEVQ